MDSQKNSTKRLIVSNFKGLMQEYSFDKISITMIVERANIRRPTFYHYFQDKYDLLEWILQDEVISKVNILLDQDMTDEAIKMLFACIGADADFYRKAFEEKGQNGFNSAFIRQGHATFLRVFERRQLKNIPVPEVLTKDNLAMYYTIGLVTSIEAWLKIPHERNVSVEKLVEAYRFLTSHTIHQLLGEGSSEKTEP